MTSISKYGDIEFGDNAEMFNFYGLFEQPFHTGTDPRFFYLSDQHKQMIDRCLRVIQDKLGFGVVLGPVGIGKSSLARVLYYRFETLPDYRMSVIYDPSGAPGAILKTILREFDQPYTYRHIDALRQAFQDFVYRETQDYGRTIVLLIDEAQTMNRHTFELLRRLLNYEGKNEKLLQIILFGQNELARRIISKPNLQNRVMSWNNLVPFDSRSVAELLEYRLFVAGRSNKEALFSPDGVVELNRMAQGIPRTICSVAYQALLVGYAHRAATINADLVREAATIALPPKPELDALQAIEPDADEEVE
jgi:general secretion pathway protein A